MTSFRKGLACVAIVLNAIWAGGIFTFPLMSPILAEHSKLSQPQLTTIVLAGMMSQYTIASVVGKVIDTYGPAICSLVAAMLFTGAYAGFSVQIYFTPDDPSPEQSKVMFHRLSLSFLCAGLGTVFAYFSSLFAASRIFPRHIGVASGTSMALFGLSPLFLSVIASRWFTDQSTETLNVTRYTAFLAISSAAVYFSSALFLHINSDVEATAASQAASSDIENRDADETTSLLSSNRKPPTYQEQSVLTLLKKSDFWLLAIFCVVTLGTSEMVISNIGSIVVSLPPYSIERTGDATAQAFTARQVKLLSLSNTISRISVGLLADFISPVASSLPSGLQVFPRRHRITRVTFLSLSSLILAWTFSWVSKRAVTRDDVWVLSVGTGIGYSSVFTVL
ncbi:hypothetical protein CC1G_04313 [Coprinopsis cinerea okayama7|uniref:MFS general substrate transporter n=1 Tax=Coprinopsis cinerea (strain Okayama-7 / 130 / ATCC MYA-4618 / FGSC 9003) TaxID=240176 RepID=A8NFN9_COPC7|nr:hypothetical protein CC1G_04313 [Coprinopsis cinerea okayama7\|eukprot:XP_001833334.2 hypothetical protein CC1G_04313 [Coprinopsis cinerea okayama7\